MYNCPATNHLQLWNNEAKVHDWRRFMCSCFLKGDMWLSCDTFCGIKPETSLSLHLTGKKSRKVMMRRFCNGRFPTSIFGSSMVETWLPQPLISAHVRDEGKIVDGSESIVPKEFINDLDFEDDYDPDIACAIEKGLGSRGAFGRIDQPVEEPWLLESSLLPQCAESINALSGLTSEEKISNYLDNSFNKAPYLNESSYGQESYSKCDEIVSALTYESLDEPLITLSERDYPVEEPWLLQPSLIFLDSGYEVNSEFSDNEGSLKNETGSLIPNDQCLPNPEEWPLDNEGKKFVHSETTKPRPHDQLQEIPEKLFLNEESRVALQEESVTTDILINSSLCTMQRIAVLEDGKLVELLLEPVKDNVQSDSVYLGTITKLVPHMGGAFVNIGCSRPSLMDIRNNREPFIFPPFRRVKRRKMNGSLLGELPEHQGMNESEHVSAYAQVIDNIEDHEDSVQYVHDDFGEHEMDDDFDELEVLKENSNGTVVGSEMEVNADRYLSNLGVSSHNSQPQTINDLTAITGHSHDSGHNHLQGVKDDNDENTSGSKWAQVQKGTKIIVQVVKEGLGTKGPTLTAYPKLRSRFWILMIRCNSIGISKKISGMERTRLKVIAKTLQPQGFGLTVRTVAAGHSIEELQKDLDGLLSTWKNITEHAKSAALAADEGVEGAIPVILHRAIGQTLSVVQDYFNDKVRSMVVDSPRTYHEVTNYLQDIAPDLCDRVELYSKKNLLFDEYKIEEELNNMLSKRVPLSNGGYLVIEQTEALVSIDVNGGHCMLGQETSQEKAILDVNLAAANQIARELRLRDIGGIIVVDFIDMLDDSNKRLVYEEVKKAVERDRSMVKVSELSRHGLMEITRKRVRPSVTFMISEPCNCCHSTGRVEALETSFSKIEREICRLLASIDRKLDHRSPQSWPKFILRVDRYMCNYLTSGKRTRLAILSSSLKAWILLKVARGFTRGAFELKLLTDDKDSRHQNKVHISLLRPKEARNTPGRKVTIFPVKKWKTSGIK